MLYDLIIIGGGPAAISAGIYAARRKTKTLLICDRWGGQLLLAPIVENYPGIDPPLLGMDLLNKMVNQLKKNDLEIIEGKKVEKIERAGEIIKVIAQDKEFEAKTIILATGRNPKTLGVEREKEMIGKGISYCATCDGPLYKNKDIAIVGGGNSGAATVLEMSVYASKIYWIVSSYKADPFFIEKIKKDSKVEIIENVRAAGIKGDKFVDTFVYRDKDSGEEKEIKVEGVFVTVGSIANSNLVENVVELNEFNEIKVNCRNISSVENIFAAGDVTDGPYKQLVVACGEGVKAALSAYDYLLDKK